MMEETAFQHRDRRQCAWGMAAGAHAAQQWNKELGEQT